MKFIMGSGGIFGGLDLMRYEGIIGIAYNNTLMAVLAFLIVVAIGILAIIGLGTVIKRIFRGKKKKETPGEKWLRTGKID